MKNSKINVIVLIILALAIYASGNTFENYYPPQEPANITALNLGDTVLSGMDVVDDSKIRKVPLLYHLDFLMEYIEDNNFLGLIDALMTGTVRTPIAQLTSGSVSRTGIAHGFIGPGILTVKDGRLAVNPPGTFVWGYKTPYTYGIKTENGLEIREGKNTGKTVSFDQINNDTVPHNYVSVESLKKWYTDSKIGDKITLDYAITNFNDGRNLVTPDQIKQFFGGDVLTYIENYPAGLKILVYEGSVTEKVIGTGGTSLGSYPEYNDVIRESNARAFVKAWNGTIIPPHSTSSGKETVGFGIATDPHAPGGGASHGACPPARALRDAVAQAGFGLPTGLKWGELSVQFGYNPAVDVKVTNTKDYPVKIVMWTEGSGPGMAIHAQVIGFIPQ